MKLAMLCAILFASSNVQAATYVYQANAYLVTTGPCGAQLLPFQLTITLETPLAASSTVTVPLKTLLVNAGGKHTWSKKFNKGNSDAAQFTTDSDGTITQWMISGAKSRRAQFGSANETNNVLDTITFKCGDAGSRNDPGVWSRTE